MRRTMIPPELLAIATRQGGLISRAQALEYLTADVLKGNVAAGRWVRRHTGVYSVTTGDLSFVGRAWAAVLVAGEGAALTGAPALRLFGSRRFASDERIVVAIDHARRAAAPQGIEIVRRRALDEVTHPAKLPRCVWIEEAAWHEVDRAARRGRESDGIALLSDLCSERLTTIRRLRDALAVRPTLRGRSVWAAVLDDVAAGAHSFIELRYLRDVERPHGLPAARRQVVASGADGIVLRDGLYDEVGVALELDGRLGHDQLLDRLRDNRRDLTAATDGLVTIRLGHADVLDPCRTAILVGTVLASRGWQGRLRACGPGCPVAAGGVGEDPVA